MTLTTFFQKNLKWITIVTLVLFLFKSIQSCNRNSKLDILSSKYENKIDSLNQNYDSLYKSSQDSIKILNFALKLSEQKTLSAEERAQAVQTAVEKIKSNTTITVKGAEEIKK